MQVYSYLMTIVKDASLAEELTQNTFFKALKAKKDFRGGSSEFTWLCAIAKNLAYDELKKNAAKASSDESLTDDSDIVEKLEDHDVTIRIHIALHNLEEPYKEVFSLRVFGELSFKDVGRVFGKTENWARVTYHRALLKLREKMGDSNE